MLTKNPSSIKRLSEFQMIVERDHCAKFKKLKKDSIQRLLDTEQEIVSHQSRHMASLATKSSLVKLGFNGGSQSALDHSVSLKNQLHLT